MNDAEKIKVLRGAPVERQDCAHFYTASGQSPTHNHYECENCGDMRSSLIQQTPQAEPRKVWTDAKEYISGYGGPRTTKVMKKIDEALAATESLDVPVDKFDKLAGRGMHELRFDELTDYIQHLAFHYGSPSAELKEACDWIVSELARKTNDENIIAVKLAKLRDAPVEGQEDSPSPESIRLAASAWYASATSHIEMIPELAIEFAKILDCLKHSLRKRVLHEPKQPEQIYKPKLCGSISKANQVRNEASQKAFDKFLEDNSDDYGFDAPVSSEIAKEIALRAWNAALATVAQPSAEQIRNDALEVAAKACDHMANNWLYCTDERGMLERGEAAKCCVTAIRSLKKKTP